MQQLLFPNVDDWVHAYTYIYRKTCKVSTHLSLWGCLCLAKSSQGVSLLLVRRTRRITTKSQFAQKQNAAKHLQHISFLGKRQKHDFLKSK